MTTLTREQAHECLLVSGWPDMPTQTNVGLTSPLRGLMVGIGLAESDLIVEASGGPNRDGSYDLGVWQINTTAWNFDNMQLVTDPYYNARCALTVYKAQGVRAWAAYSVKDEGGVFPYARRMPPGQGGPSLLLGSRGALVRSWQRFLNRSTPPAQLVEDGAYGVVTEAATMGWKRLHHNDGTRSVNSGTWKAAGLL